MRDLINRHASEIGMNDELKRSGRGFGRLFSRWALGRTGSSSPAKKADSCGCWIRTSAPSPQSSLELPRFRTASTSSVSAWLHSRATTPGFSSIVCPDPADLGLIFLNIRSAISLTTNSPPHPPPIRSPWLPTPPDLTSTNSRPPPTPGRPGPRRTPGLASTLHPPPTQ